MSILAQFNLDTKSCTFEVNCESQSPEIQIGFVSNLMPVKFKDLKFGFTACKGDQIVCEHSFPTEGISYVETDQKYLIAKQIDVSYKDRINLSVWAENNGIQYQGSTEFHVPEPKKPFNSWLWKNNRWVAPAAYPDDDSVFYTWDENIRRWIPITD